MNSSHNVFTWKTAEDGLLIFAGSLVQALSMRLFLIPGELVSGGVSGAAQIINFFTHWPIGLMVFVGNMPLFLVGWRYLGGRRFVLRTAWAVVTFSLLTDLLSVFIPHGLITDNVLNSIYGGLSLGVGLGLVYRGQGTSGGSDILGRVLNYRLGLSISQAYMVTDTLVVLAGGFSFGWEKALYGLIVIYVSGLAAEAISEGSRVYRTALIITSKSQSVTDKILNEMCRGVTILSATGAYTGEPRPVLYCVITRAEVSQLKALVHEVDPKAFMVIGTATEALGEGFSSLKQLP